jgi:hypothetical protein
MLIVFTTCGIAFFWWLLAQLDASREVNCYSGRTFWWGSMITGALIGVFFRMKAG